jgi:hypothetical protein
MACGFATVNVVMMVAIMMVLPFALTSVGLGTIGGLLGEHTFEASK